MRHSGDLTCAAPDIGGGILADGPGRLEISGSRIEYNDAINNGGGIGTGTELELWATRILGNTAQSFGGGIFINQPVSLKGSKVTGNFSLDG